MSERSIDIHIYSLIVQFIEDTLDDALLLYLIFASKNSNLHIFK